MRAGPGGACSANHAAAAFELPSRASWPRRRCTWRVALGVLALTISASNASPCWRSTYSRTGALRLRSARHRNGICDTGGSTRSAMRMRAASTRGRSRATSSSVAAKTHNGISNQLNAASRIAAAARRRRTHPVMLGQAIVRDLPLQSLVSERRRRSMRVVRIAWTVAGACIARTGPVGGYQPLSPRQRLRLHERPDRLVQDDGFPHSTSPITTNGLFE